jgi:hypothetical protein
MLFLLRKKGWNFNAYCVSWFLSDKISKYLIILTGRWYDFGFLIFGLKPMREIAQQKIPGLQPFAPTRILDFQTLFMTTSDPQKRNRFQIASQCKWWITHNVPCYLISGLVINNTTMKISLSYEIQVCQIFLFSHTSPPRQFVNLSYHRFFFVGVCMCGLFRVRWIQNQK